MTTETRRDIPGYEGAYQVSDLGRVRSLDRRIVWFSCGVASAAAARLFTSAYGESVEVVYCNTLASEHPDNARFLNDVGNWLKRDIRIISSAKYRTIDDVFMETGYMSGPRGARCTVELKKVPRFGFQAPDDIHIFGFTSEELKRIKNFNENNPDIRTDWGLAEFGYTKDDCAAMVQAAGIELPVMYRLGYRNNNCIGCVKASSPAYWSMVRRDFPEVFARRARQSRELGCRLTRLAGERLFLDELPAGTFKRAKLENVSCGPECGIQLQGDSDDDL